MVLKFGVVKRFFDERPMEIVNVDQKWLEVVMNYFVLSCRFVRCQVEKQVMANFELEYIFIEGTV